MEKLLLSPADAGTMLDLGRTKIYELMQSGQLESLTVGRRRLIPKEAISDFVQRVRAEQAVEA